VSYEHAIRCKAVSLVKRNGSPLKDALRVAWEDPTTKERHFTTPLCLEATRKRGTDNRPEPPQKFQHKGERKGAGKGKTNKGKGKGKGNRCANTTPDGTKICFKYNNEKEKCKNPSCSFAHVCGVCFAKGVPLYSCTHSK
jgi:hypothetical protein